MVYSRAANTAPVSASAATLHTDAAIACGRVDSAPLTCEPLRFEGEELPHIWKLRKYAFTSAGGAHEESPPPKKVEK